MDEVLEIALGVEIVPDAAADFEKPAESPAADPGSLAH
jgi:hypothetical protein